MSANTLPLESHPRAITLFGREPASWLGILEAGLAVLIAFGLGVTNTSAGLISALVSMLIGLYTAWATKDTMLGAVTGVAKAGIALMIYYGVTLTDSQVAAVVFAVPLLVGFWQRGQTSPVVDPVSPSPTQVTLVPPTPDVVEGIEEKQVAETD